MVASVLFQSFRLSDGRILAYAEYGTPGAKPVFYFHGAAGSRLEPAMLDGNDLLKAGIRLIACDRPGMGGSDFQRGRAFSDWPADIVALAGSLRLAKFGVFGVSGGVDARKVAASIPGCQATFYPGQGHFSTVMNHLDEILQTLGQ